jgi:hypothetical protein
MGQKGQTQGDTGLKCYGQLGARHQRMSIRRCAVVAPEGFGMVLTPIVIAQR